MVVTGVFLQHPRCERVARTHDDGPELADDVREGGRGEELLRSGASPENTDVDRQPSWRRPRGATRGPFARTVNPKVAAHRRGGRNLRTGSAQRRNQRGGRQYRLEPFLPR